MGTSKLQLTHEVQKVCWAAQQLQLGQAEGPSAHGPRRDTTALPPACPLGVNSPKAQPPSFTGHNQHWRQRGTAMAEVNPCSKMISPFHFLKFNHFSSSNCTSPLFYYLSINFTNLDMWILFHREHICIF